jgi:hypothetical protein
MSNPHILTRHKHAQYFVMSRVKWTFPIHAKWKYAISVRKKKKKYAFVNTAFETNSVRIIEE